MIYLHQQIEPKEHSHKQLKQIKRRLVIESRHVFTVVPGEITISIWWALIMLCMSESLIKFCFTKCVEVNMYMEVV